MTLPGGLPTSDLTCVGAVALFFRSEKLPHGASGPPEVVQIEVQRPLTAKIHFLDVIFSDFERNFI